MSEKQFVVIYATSGGYRDYTYMNATSATEAKKKWAKYPHKMLDLIETDGYGYLYLLSYNQDNPGGIYE